MTMHQNKSLRSLFFFKYQISTFESFKQFSVKLFKKSQPYQIFIIWIRRQF